MEDCQDGEMGQEKMPGALEESSQWNFPVMSVIYDLGWESKGKEKPVGGDNGSSELTGALTVATSKTSAMQAEGKNLLFSKYGRKYHNKSELGLMREKQNPSECPTLGGNIQQHCYLDKHFRIHTGEKQNELSSCRSFHWRDGLVGHWNSHKGETPYQCPEDGENFSSRKMLKRDQGIQTEGRRYECAQCGKCFRHRQTLTKHQKIHTGEKLHQCPVCGKSFTSREPLIRHQRVHTGEKPYECSQCGKCFRQRVHLMCHQKTHTGEKPFRCPDCGRSFSRRDKLIRHQRTHRGQRPYACPKCEKSFGQKAMLVKHWRIHEES